MDKQERIIAGLQSPMAFPHAVGDIQIIETHISWVILSGEYAYKIKKSVDYGFLDFSSLAQRKHFCEREVMRNNNYSAGIYLDVVEVRGQLAQPFILGKKSDNKKGELLEYAVKMKQFEHGKLLSDLALQNKLDSALIEKVAKELVKVHHNAKPLLTNSIRLIEKASMSNIQALSWPANFDADDMALIEDLNDWTLTQLTELNECFLAREKEGKVRYCHGDLHLGNITVQDDTPIFFDCIEFNDDLCAVDLMSELAFLLMDLEYQQQPMASNLLLNRYLQLTGDYQGLSVLRFYMVYRALVRAKVNSLLVRHDTQFALKTKHQFIYLKHLHLAKSFLPKRKPSLTITHGVSASGKTTQAKLFAAANHAVHISSDIERKRLFGLSETEQSDSGVDEGIYTVEFTRKTYSHLLYLATLVLDAGYSVLVDASFLSKIFRDSFYQLAHKKGLPFFILHCDAPSECIHERLKNREQNGDSISEADIDVLAKQLSRQDPLSSFESKYVLRSNTVAEANQRE